MQYKKPRRWVNKLFIHCSASDNPDHDDVSVMRRWHKARGWSDVGYHFFIKKDGTIQEGRSVERIPAANRNDKKIPGFSGNAGTLTACLHGLKEDKFTEAQFDSLRSLCKSYHDIYKGNITFHGHREIAYKSCPVFDYKKVLNLSKSGRLGST